MNVYKQFAKYVSLNICGMIGLSLYVLADSFFISVAQGANGLTALNLVLPIYNLIFAIGAMIGVGAAIRFSIAQSKGEEKAKYYFFQAIFFTGVIGVIFMILGVGFTKEILIFLGADQEILAIGIPYTKIFMAFSPIFMWNYVFNSFVRNDGAPSIAMAATLLSSLFNIVFDYVLMFPLGMGMSGAALATALSPLLGIFICLIHVLSKKSHIQFKISKPSLRNLFSCCQVGVSAFVGEMSSGIITLSFNYLIMLLAGNVGVAAYGIVANISLVAVAAFNGISQGSQPLISTCYGKGNQKAVTALRNLSLTVTLIMAVLIYSALFIFTNEIVSIFNSEGSKELASYAFSGVRIYFTGIFFAGLNIVGSSFFSATEKAKQAFWTSILRGFVLILFFAFLLAFLFKMTGVWLAYAVAEACTTLIMVIMWKKM